MIWQYLRWALACHQTDIFRWMLETKLAEPQAFLIVFAESLLPVYASGNVEALLIFLGLGGDLPRTSPLLSSLIELGDVAMLSFVNEIAPGLVQRDPNAVGSPAIDPLCLARAAASGCVSLLEFLLGLPVEFPLAAKYLAIESAFDHGHGDVVRFLIANVDPEGIKLRIAAILRGGAARGPREIGEWLIPFMTEIDDIRDSIELATRARNVELAKLWLEWQRRRNPSLLLDHILIGVASRCLEIPRFMGTPSREVIAQIVRISAGSRFLDGLKYAFEFLSPSEKAGFVDRYWSAGVGSPDRAITSFFCQSDLGWRQALLAALQMGNTALVAQTLARVPSGESLNFVRARTTPLVIAAAYGNMDNLNLLLSVPGLDPMMPDLTGTSPFVTACRSGDFAVIQRLAEFCGESVSESECEVNAGFFWASKSPIIDARFELIPFFSRFPSLDPNFLVWGSSAFISAAASGHVPLLESLLAFPGIDVNARDAAGVTALTRAIECEAVACVSLLLADPRVDPHVATISNWYPLSRAVATDSLELVELLLASDRFDLGVVGGQALATSIVWDDPDMSAVLIGRPDLDVNGCFATGPWDLPPRLKAICRERRDRLPPISERPPCCLMLAIDQDNVALVNAIIAHPTFDPVRSHLAHAVFRALRANVGAIAQALLGNQANIAQRGPRGRSLLAAAIGCNSRHLELIGRHPAFNISDQSPRQCVHAMARAQSLDAFEFLSRFPEVDLASPLPHGTNGFPDEVFRARRDWNRSKATEGLPPVFSLRYYHMTVSKLLANPRVDGTQRGKHGQTILFEVVREAPSSAFVGQLFGVDPNATDRHQNTLVHCAALTRPPPPIWRVDMLQCDWTIRNENADAIWEMANSRARRRIYT